MNLGLELRGCWLPDWLHAVGLIDGLIVLIGMGWVEDGWWSAESSWWGFGDVKDGVPFFQLFSFLFFFPFFITAYIPDWFKLFSFCFLNSLEIRLLANAARSVVNKYREVHS